MADRGYFHPVILKDRIIPGNIFLAPLAGFSDRAFRHICISHGASFTYTEMVSCEGILRNNEKTTLLTAPADNEHLYGIQLFTSVPDSAARAVEKASKFNPTLFDLNCGCPVPKVVRSGAGAALLKEPEKIGKIIRSMYNATDHPITVKIRSGWDAESINYDETAAAAVENGAVMVTLHARTRTQGYSGTANRDHIEDLQKKTFVPVFASGDIYSPQAAAEVMAVTGCAGVIFARGALGNPFVFQQTQDYFKTGSYQQPDVPQKLHAALEHLEYARHYLGEARACKEMKKHLCSYTKGIPGGATLRNKIVHVEEYEEYREIFMIFFGNGDGGKKDIK